MSRLSPSVFKIPADKLRAGYYTDRYFLRTRDVLIKDKREIHVGYQFFVRDEGVVCGLDEAVAILKTCAGRYRDPVRADRLYQQLRNIQWKLQEVSAKQMAAEIRRWERERTKIRQQLNLLWINGWDQIRVYALTDGQPVQSRETVLAITGNPILFVHLETPLLGAIARPTATATAVAKVVEAARGKQIFFFSARFDHYWVQAIDGYAALKAGAFAVSTDANADYWGIESMGTVPHFLIGCYRGNTAEAMLAFDRYTEPGINRIALVDWDNDCIRTTRRVLERLIVQKTGLTKINDKRFEELAPQVVGNGKGKLWGVRLDTSEKLRDRSVLSPDGFGVCPELIVRARREFDRWGCRHLKIVASGGFTAERIRRFERLKVPVDAYGVGSSLLRQRIDVTADIVEFERKQCSKVGRKKGDWSRLKRVL
jgi:nicotinate phosphoribosyltransferase